MLKSLRIENIAVIEKAEVDFSGGLSVLTGETGAGKSIMIDALNAVLGSRTSRELVRTGAEKASVTALFDSDNAASWCEENDIDVDDGELVLQRRMTPDGKSSARVNGVPVSAAQLRALGSLLLDIHGQNDGRQLLDERRHLEYLDRFGVESSVYETYREKYQAYRELVRQTEALRMDEAQKLQTEDLLRARIRELENADIKPGEETELTERRDLLRNSEKLTEFLDSAYTALYEGEDNAVSLAAEAEYAIDRAGAWSPALSQTAELVRQARMSLEDAAEQLREKRAELDFSPEEYDALEERLSRLRRLEKKYAVDESGLAALLKESRDRLDELEYAEDRLLKLQKETDAALKEARKAADSLSAAREEAGELRELNMPSVRFKVQLQRRTGKDALTAEGADEVRFAMSANAGEALGPISRIASGGELSRIMLALKNVFAEKDTVETLIFDEIDTGVSGAAAQKVAEKLAKLAKNRQVLCVTHLPQIAAMAGKQYLVEKQERGGRTYTEIRLLDREGRKREIARINGGAEITPALLQSAEELLHSAEQFRDAL